MSTYQLVQGGSVLRIADGAMIPPDPGNADYRTYLAWVAAGNTPDPVAQTPINQNAQLTARIDYKARQLERSGQLLEAYALRNHLTIPS